MNRINPAVFKTVLITLADQHKHTEDAKKDLEELQSLIATFGAIDIVHIIQHRNKPDTATYIGSGKVSELVDIVKKSGIHIVVINDIVNSSQLYRLTKALWQSNPDIKVWDRIDLILHIFDKHAHTAEAKLQIEIARMQHMGPSMYGLGDTYFSRQGGGIGTKGLGETNIELMKRHWRNQIKKKKEQLEKLDSLRKTQMQRRKELGIKTVSIIGYTNAGKTSLFNVLTGKKKVVQNALFVTLDSTTGKLYFPDSRQLATVSDTIGFIRSLPSSLIESFKSTLMESINADLLLHVIDLSDANFREKISVVEGIIGELGIPAKNKIYVFNKIDAIDGTRQNMVKTLSEKYADFSPHFISVKTREEIDNLKKLIEKELY